MGVDLETNETKGLAFYPLSTNIENRHIEWKAKQQQRPPPQQQQQQQQRQQQTFIDCVRFLVQLILK